MATVDFEDTAIEKARPASAASRFRRAWVPKTSPRLGGSRTLRLATTASRPTYLQQILAQRAPRQELQERVRQLKHELQEQERLLALQDTVGADEMRASVAFAVAGTSQPMHASLRIRAASADLYGRTLEVSRKREAEQGRRLERLEQASMAVSAQVLAVEECLLAFWMMRGGGEEGDTSIAAFFRTASGLTWAPIGTARPTLGRELVNKELRDALAQKLKIDASEDGTNGKAVLFTRGEWDRLGVRLHPGVNYFVKVGDSFFKPAEHEGAPATLNAEELGTVVRETLGFDLDPAHDTSLLERLTRAPRYETPLLLTLLLSLQTRVSL